MKLRTGIVFGIGYLLGTKAGRDRYEQLRRLYRRTTSNERVRQVIDQGKELVDTGTSSARRAVAQHLTQTGEYIRQHVDSND